MTYDIARPFLIKIIEAVPPSSHLVLPSSLPFKHEAAGNDDTTLRSRSIHLEARGPSKPWLDYTPDIAGQPRIATGMELVVDYRAVAGKLASLDVDMECDARDLMRLLLNPASVAPRTTSCIDLIDKLTWQREDRTTGDKRTRFRFDMVYF